MEIKEKEVGKKYPLKREEAELRKSELVDLNGNYHVEYKLLLTLRKSTHLNKNYAKNNFEGILQLKFLYFGKTESDLFLNFNGDVHSVRINGEQIPTNYSERRIWLDRSKLRKGNDVTDIDEKLNEVVILFSAKYDKGGVGLHHFIDPMDKREYLYTQFEPYECHLVFPVFDQPDIKATLELSLAGPNDWVLLSNENENWIKELNLKDELISNYLSSLTTEENNFLYESVSEFDQKYNIASFKRTPKISSYLYAICAGPYFCIEDPNKYKVPLRIFMRESLKNAGEPNEFFRITIAGMEWYKDFFGLAYPFNKYDQIYTPEYNFGAMENVGLVTYNEFYCWKETPTQQKRARFCITVLHELAHMWFGNLVTMKWWDDLWLNESFATFISFLCQSQAVQEEYPTSWSSFNSSKGIAYREDQKSTTHPVMGDITDTDKAQSHFDAIVYYKGSSLLKQMFYFIGQDSFSKGLKAYFKKFAWTNTVFDDFVDKMVEAINEDKQVNFDLKSLSKNWLLKAGLNQIEADWEEDIENKIKTFNIKQTPCLSQHSNLQVHMIDVLLVYDDGKTVHQNIMVNHEEFTSVSSLNGLPAPKAVILNYNDWGYCKWIIDSRSLQYLKTNLHQRIPDTLTRQLFYRSIFDLARDAKISCPEYLDIILVLLEHETNEDILSSTLRNISGLISSYVPLKFYNYYSSQMFDLVSKLLVNNMENKEIVLNLIELLIVFASSEDHRQFLKSWLIEGPYLMKNGEKVLIPSGMLNQDNRFSIVAFIHTSRQISLEEKTKLLESEIERDKNSDRSVRARCKCRSALPDPEIKKELWNKFVNQPESESLYNMKSYMSYFVCIDQLDLVECFLNTNFFEEALKVGKQDFFYVDAFVSYCGPIYYVNLEVIEKLEKLAEEAKEYDSLRRRLLELSDDMRRFLKAQSLADVYLSIVNK
jgi:aminopeptidase N